MDWRERAKGIILDMVLPIGMVCMLTGMLWLGDHGRYPKVFLAFVLPSLVLLALDPSNWRGVIRSPVVLAFLVFAAYFSVSTAWSTAESGFGDLIKRLLLVFVLFFGVVEFARQRSELFYKTIAVAALLAPIGALYEIARFFIADHGMRLASDGALYNPLLISHVYGFFTALWLGWLLTQSNSRRVACGGLIALILLLLLVLTGSRTPLLAITATTVALTVVSGSRKGLFMLAVLAAFALVAGFVFPEIVTQRGLSYRPEIWSEAMRQILERPWFGHGFGTPLFIKLSEIPYPFRDPHNLTLAVLFDGGVVGLFAWVVVYATAFSVIWKCREHPWAIICSATVVYGLVAGMTEGGSFLSRPKEHWFLIWIPLALVAAIPARNMDHA